MLSSRIAPGAVSLDLHGVSKEDVLTQLVALLQLPDSGPSAVVKLLKRREALGSTGVGRGIAIPHARTTLVDRLQLAFGRHADGVAYGAIDARPVRHFFLIVAPASERSNEYLPVLGRVAQFAKEPDVPDRLAALGRTEELFALLREKGL
jgi:mannitol/fructose-specific phosphotransferase system IIA component (Ntr-type)